MAADQTPSSGNAGTGRSILQNAVVVGVMTAMSRVLGLVREIAMGYFFGTSALKSAFDLAFLVPNLFRRLFGEGALINAFVPIFGEIHKKQGREEAFRFAWKVVWLLAVFLSCVTALGILLTWPTAACLSETSRWLLPMPMLRIMLPYALLICVTAIFSGILNTLGRFAIPALTPLLLNLIWLVAMLALFPFFPGDLDAQMKVLCWTVLAAGVVQMLFQLPLLLKLGGRIRLRLDGVFQDRRVRRVLRNMVPAAIGGGLIQINVCLDKTLAFYADASGPAALEYAERIVYLPMGMFATAFVTVLLPTFSKQVAADDFSGMRESLERSIRQLTLIMAPCSAALILLAYPVISLIYGIKGGHFGAESTVLCARALAAYAPGLILFSFQKTLTPAFHAMQDTKTPMRVGILGICVNVVSDVTSIYLLPVGWKHVGIAISTVLTSCVTSSVLWFLLFRRIQTPRFSRLLAPIGKIVACSLAMGGAAFWIWPRVAAFSERVAGDGKLAQILSMGVVVFVAMAVYAGLVALVDIRLLREVAEDLRGRRKRKR
ncbi:MAG: murein biosynthesis integral membrane protein MurJ [Kiritimatiellae bacterium]|nr:murein biosynthesis integral membrane protein MurJ [Kiritimatiellia bacterium]